MIRWSSQPLTCPSTYIYIYIYTYIYIYVYNPVSLCYSTEESPRDKVVLSAPDLPEYIYIYIYIYICLYIYNPVSICLYIYNPISICIYLTLSLYVTVQRSPPVIGWSSQPLTCPSTYIYIYIYTYIYIYIYNPISICYSTEESPCDKVVLSAPDLPEYIYIYNPISICLYIYNPISLCYSTEESPRDKVVLSAPDLPEYRPKKSKQKGLPPRAAHNKRAAMATKQEQPKTDEVGV